ncbi:MAG: hypothetical protein ABEN55_15300 [Bradymonadaceae bacterium]
MGGWSPQDLSSMGIQYEGNEEDFRHFPHWHNRWSVPTNSFEPPTDAGNPGDDPVFGSNTTAFDEEGGLEDNLEVRTANEYVDWNWDVLQQRQRTTALDEMYDFLIGSEAVRYLSNHAHSRYVQPANIEQVFVDRDPVINQNYAYDVHPQTLDVREYNTMIASTDESGAFKRGTIAEQFWGDIQPQHANISDASVEEAIQYNERYGASEVELLETFLGNTPIEQDGRLVWVGPTFGGDEEISLLQAHILEYIEDLEPREAGGGVPG